MISSAVAIPGAQGFDTDSVLTAATAAQLYDMGFVWCARYVSRAFPNAVGDISPAEVDAILTAGLCLMLAQHCPPKPWTPSAALGAQYGQAASFNVAYVGYPAATLVLDLENMRPGCGVPAITAHVNAWAKAVEAAGYQPCLYFSADCPLTPPQLYLDLVVKRYWRSLSADTPAVAVRGPCIQQFAQAGQVAGIDIDRDIIVADAFGGLPSWMVPG